MQTIGNRRDTMELVRRGAKGYVLDYTFGSLRLMQEDAKHLGRSASRTGSSSCRSP